MGDSMGWVYVSVLGTTNYKRCTYCIGDNVAASNVRFVQEATISHLCRSWGPHDRIMIFTTPEAYKKNWLDKGHPDTDEQRGRKGLCSCLEALGLDVPFTNVMIPEGQSEEEIWTIFQTIYDNLCSGDQVIFDVTHGFRSIPMLVLVVLHYAKAMKQVKLAGIHYGAWEAAKTVSVTDNTAAVEQRVPIFDLTPFASLLDWTVAIDRFLGAGDATPAKRLAHAHVATFPISARKDPSLATLKKVTNSLENLAKDLATCRGPSIGPTALELKSLVKDYLSESNHLPPLKALLEQVGLQVQHFDGNTVQDGIRAARWCMEHNLIQQGYTILQEILKTHMCEQVGAATDNKDYREIVGSSAAIRARDIPRDEWQGHAGRHPDMTQMMLGYLDAHPDFVKLFDLLTQLRNTMNHAVFPRYDVSAEQLVAKLKDLMDRAESFVLGCEQPEPSEHP
jgi:CRISPR-associated Csx2 family protein